MSDDQQDSQQDNRQYISVEAVRAIIAKRFAHVDFSKEIKSQISSIEQVDLLTLLEDAFHVELNPMELFPLLQGDFNQLVKIINEHVASK